MATKYDYKGELITGTSTSAKKFKNSKVKEAKHGQTYLNTKSGHVYVCDKGGKPADATWKYKKTVVVKKPSTAVGLSIPTRGTDGSLKFAGKWKVPKALLNEKNGDRAEGLYITWALNIPGADPVDVWKTANEQRTDDSEDLSNFHATKPKNTYTRQSFWPYTNVKCTGITLKVRPYNSKGKGPEASKTFAFKTPRVPSLSGTSLDENGIVSCTVTTNAGHDALERVKTRIQVDVYDSSGNNPQWETVQDFEVTATERKVTQQVENWQVFGKYVKVRFRALARGLAGDSAWSGYKTHTVGWPNAATIDGESMSIPGKSSNDVATFPVKVNEDDGHKTTQVVLQRLVNVDASTEAQATAMVDDWRDTDYKDDAKCTALACSVGDLLPDDGKWSWVRVKSWHDIEGVFYTYSKPARLDALHVEKPTASDDAIKIVRTEQGVNGSSYKVVMGWNADGADDADGTQLTWSDEPDAWESTERPTEFEFEESDGPLVDGSTTYRDSRIIVVKGLSEGEPTYLRARRYMDDVDGNRQYGPYSDQVTVIPTVAPSDVVLIAPPFAAAGADVAYSWAFAGGGTQRGWQLVDDATETVISEGTDAFGSATVGADRLASFAVGGVVAAFVRVSTGGAYVASDAVRTSIVQAPRLSIGPIGTLTSNALSIPLASNSSTPTVAIVVTANGADRQTAHGTVGQPEGDTVWSGVVRPEWAASVAGYAATVALPEGLALIDGASYTVTATATDSSTGLQSPTVTATFACDWAVKAPQPPTGEMRPTSDAEIVEGKTYFTRTGEGTAADPYAYEEVDEPVASGLPSYYEQGPSIEVEPATVTDEDGNLDRICAITLVAPEGAPDGCLYDIYRVTHEGIRRIAAGYPLTATVTDQFAPFGDVSCAYRVSCRTPDGDEQWADYDYSLEGACIRLDFAGSEHRYAELPYDIALGDSFRKDYEGRMHMDGSRGGGWEPGVERKASLSTDVMRIDDADTVEALYDMAQTAGPVFVRTPAGAAFEANVDMDADVDNDQVLSVSLDAEECGLTDEFMLPPYEYREIESEG